MVNVKLLPTYLLLAFLSSFLALYIAFVGWARVLCPQAFPSVAHTEKLKAPDILIAKTK